MCWISEEIPKRQIADNDIPVFKMLRKGHFDGIFVSPYFGFIYAVGKVYSKKNPITIVGGITNFMIKEGYHSYSSKTVIVYNRSAVYSTDNGKVDILLDCYEECTEVSGYIPRGSVYYLNNQGEYVSDKIVLVKPNAV